MGTYIVGFLDQTIFGNSILGYATALCIFGIGMLVIRLVVRVLIRKFRKLAERTASTLDDFLVDIFENIALPLLHGVVVYLALKSLVLPEAFEKTLNGALLVVLMFFSARAAASFLGYVLKIYLKKRGSDATLEKSLQGILFLIRLLVWGGAMILLLDNLGFKVSAVIAGLGIGGVAVALAAQAILKDLFSYFCILFDHPFKVGDFIIIGDYMGTIEHIGVKTTRIRSLGGEMLIFSNSDLTDSRLRNYRLMDKRRVVFKIGVVYQTPLKQLKEIPSLVEGIIAGVEDALVERVHFASFGDFSLIFEIVYHVVGGDYKKYMDIQQEINWAIKEEFEKRGIEFAFPTQTLYVQKGSTA